MRIVRNGKEYDYDYKTILIKGDTHEKLRSEAEKRGIKMTRLINQMLETIGNESRI